MFHQLRVVTSSYIKELLKNSMERLWDNESAKGQKASWYYYENSFDLMDPLQGFRDPQGLDHTLWDLLLYAILSGQCDLASSFLLS